MGFLRQEYWSGLPFPFSNLENSESFGKEYVAKSWTGLRDFTFTFHFHAMEKEMATHSSILAWRIPGTEEPVGCRLWGRTELDTTDVT